MYSSQFDGNAAFSGGGFMPSQATQSADPSISPAKNRDAQGIVAVTVKQINEGCLASNESSSFIIDGIDVSSVTIVGLMLNKAEKITEVSFVLDDGTGRINVIRWVNEMFDTNEMEKVVDGMYVRVHASLKGFQGKKTFVCLCCQYSSARRFRVIRINFIFQPLTDFNELTYHFMECMYVHMYNTKLRVASAPADSHNMSSVSGTPYRGQQGTQQNQFPGQSADLMGVDQMVMDYLQQPANLAKEKGCNINELVQRLGIPKDKIMSSIMVLEGEGLVYSTIDEEHYKSTANA